MGRTTLACLLALALVVAGCADDEDVADAPNQTATETETLTTTETETVTGTETETETETATATETETDELALAQQCTNPEAGYRVSYPEGWQTNSGDIITACRLFDPAEIQLEEGTEIPPEISVHVNREPVAFDQATDFGSGFEVLERREVTVAGHDGLAVLLEATQDAPLLEPGTQVYSYYVGIDEETLIASTYSVGELDFERERELLDRMIETLELTG